MPDKMPPLPENMFAILIDFYAPHLNYDTVRHAMRKRGLLFEIEPNFFALLTNDTIEEVFPYVVDVIDDKDRCGVIEPNKVLDNWDGETEEGFKAILEASAQA